MILNEGNLSIAQGRITVSGTSDARGIRNASSSELLLNDVLISATGAGGIGLSNETGARASVDRSTMIGSQASIAHCGSGTSRVGARKVVAPRSGPAASFSRVGSYTENAGTYVALNFQCQ